MTPEEWKGPRTGETAQERKQRRDALLRYGHIFSDAHRQVSSVRHAARLEHPIVDRGWSKAE